jgi:isopentenyl-diphosphate delta-isomerase
VYSEKESSLSENVILVDEDDVEVGVLEKMVAHKNAALHRAVSVIIVDDKKNILMQRRSRIKYHSGLKWANACCTHPRPGEHPQDCVNRRLHEELGLVAQLQYLGKICYLADVGSSLHEHEMVWLYGGYYDGPVPFNSEEVAQVGWWPLNHAIRAGQQRGHEMAAWWHEYCDEQNLALWLPFAQQRNIGIGNYIEPASQG